MTFELASLHLATDFDVPLGPATLPCEINSSTERAAVLADGIGRSHTSHWFLGASQGLLGIRLPAWDEDLRVSLSLRADQTSLHRWRELTEDEGGDPGYRLVDVSIAQRLRGSVLLRQPLQGEPNAGYKLVCDVPATDLVAPEPLVIEFAEARRPAGSAAFGHDGALGIQLIRVLVERLEGRAPVTRLSTGFPPGDDGRPVRGDLGLVVLNRSAPGPARDLAVVAARGTRTAPEVRALDAGDTPVEVSTSRGRRRRGTATVRVPEGDGPVFLSYRSVGDRTDDAWLTRILPR